ncbi:hypothetical protein DFH06DRAFT_1324836 [Mycena polygramma]|nr:hypothetical protein DFH06DRAFT_1324836 [Mycena polygramma]
MSTQSGVSGKTSSFIPGPGGIAPIQDSGRKAGDVVLAPEALQIIRKMDILRLERNNKREERRKAGEDGVSDDEEDELTAFLVVAPSGENPQPQGETGTPPSLKLADALPNSQLLLDDAVAAKNSFQAHDNSIPAAVFSLAKNGISPPLTLFLPASLERIRASNVKTVKHGTGDTAKVTVIDVADFPTEDSLDQATWQTSYNTFLSFMEIAVGLLIFQSPNITIASSRIPRLSSGFSPTDESKQIWWCNSP